MTAASVAVALAVAAPAVTAQMSQDKSQEKTTEMKKAPGQPDPNDRGGEFTITGCINQTAPQNGQPMMFMITKVSPGQANVGEGRVMSAMGGGTPVTGVTHSSAADHQDPPDIVRGEYRIVSTERTDLAKFANQQVEARGRLRSVSMSGERDKTPMKVDAAAPKTGANADVFEASSVKKVAGSCSTK
jgi:hypothetical protein